MNKTTLLAVNGTLMRGLELNGNMTAAGGVFSCVKITPIRITGSGALAIVIRE